jgi:RNA polymerase sigma factor (sigma-70 family)
MVSLDEFNALLVKYMPFIRGQVYRRGFDDREDVVQSVVLEACRRRENFDPSKGAFLTWLRWVIRSQLTVRANSARRRQHINLPLEHDEDGQPFLEAVATDCDAHISLELSEVMDGVAKLRTLESHIVTQIAVGTSLDELADEHDCSKQYIHQTLKKGRERLRWHLRRSRTAQGRMESYA